MSENTIPNPCGSTGSWVETERPIRLRPARQERRARQQSSRVPGARRRSGPSSPSTPSTSRQESERRGNRRIKWSKVSKGLVKQRHVRRFRPAASHPRRLVNGAVRRRQPTVPASQLDAMRRSTRRMQIAAENTLNQHHIILSQLTSLETLRHELEGRMEAVLRELSTAVDNPSNALPRIAAAADAQVAIMKKLVQLLRRIDDSGLID